MPQNVRDLTVAALNCQVLVIENVSHISAEVSDYLCQIISGFGCSMRKLYTDSEEVILYIEKPIIINGIEEVCTRPDFLDRAVQFTLPAIPRSQRKSEEQIWLEFARDYPKIFGGLLNTLAAALRELPNVPHQRDERMADFARFALAVERALSWKPGSVMEAYEESRLAGRASVLENCLFADVIRRQADFGFYGTATKLLESIDKSAGKDFQIRRQKGYPKTPHQLSGMLRRLAPAFRAEGIEIIAGKSSGTNSQRFVQIDRIASSATEKERGLCDVGDDSDAGVAPVSDSLSQERPIDGRVLQ